MTGTREPRLENAAKKARETMLLHDITPCRSSGRPDDWFSDPGDRAAVRRAKAGCRNCPVVQACGEWAIETGQRWGVWGNMTTAERRAEVRRRARRRAA